MTTSIQAIQSALKVSPGGKWDAATSTAMRAYQGSHGIIATGLPDPPTLAALGLENPKKNAIGPVKTYLDEGKEPGTFMRDLGSSLNQVPRFVWGLMTVAFLGLAVWSYKRQQPEKRRRSGTRRLSGRRTTRRRSRR